MKHFIIVTLTLFMFGFSMPLQAQNTDMIYLKSNFWGNKFFKGDTIISVNQVLEEMAPNESVYNLMLNAKKDFVFAQILGATGGVLIGWPLGTALVGGDPNWAMAGIGVGIVAVSIPISINFKKKSNHGNSRT